MHVYSLYVTYSYTIYLVLIYIFQLCPASSNSGYAPEWGNKMNFSLCVNMSGFSSDSHILGYAYINNLNLSLMSHNVTCTTECNHNTRGL